MKHMLRAQDMSTKDLGAEKVQSNEGMESRRKLFPVIAVLNQVRSRASPAAIRTVQCRRLIMLTRVGRQRKANLTGTIREQATMEKGERLPKFCHAAENQEENGGRQMNSSDRRHPRKGLLLACVVFLFPFFSFSFLSFWLETVQYT